MEIQLRIKTNGTFSKWQTPDEFSPLKADIPNSVVAMLESDIIEQIAVTFTGGSVVEFRRKPDA